MKLKTSTKEFLYKYGVIYLNTICLMIGPYFVQTPYGKIISMLGLALLTIQTQRTKAYNITLINIVAFIGWSYSLFKQLFE